MSAQTNNLKNTISRKHSTSAFFLQSTHCCMKSYPHEVTFGWSLKLIQTERGEELVEQICLIVFSVQLR